MSNAEELKTSETYIRRGELNNLVEMLRDQETKKHDAVVPAQSIEMLNNGKIQIAGMPIEENAQLAADIAGIPGVQVRSEDRMDVTYRTIYNAHTQLHERLHYLTGKKRWWGYYKHMLNEAPHLLAENVNHWLRNDSRNFFVRTFRPLGDENPGVLRAVLSDKYKVMDNLDLLFTMLSSLKDSGIRVDVKQCDLTSRRMYVCISAPDVYIEAPELLKSYRNPESGNRGLRLTAGLILENSEVGHGARTVAPRPFAPVCFNALRWKPHEMRKHHLGSQMDEGIIQWSDDTKRANMELIEAQTKDAVEKWLSEEYLHELVNTMLEKGKEDLQHPSNAVSNVCSDLQISEDEQDDIMRYFMRSGDTRRVGVAQAITYHAQQLEDAERQYELEGSVAHVLSNMDEYDVPANGN